MYDKLFKFFSFLDIPSGIIVGSWSIVFLVGCAYSIYETKQVTMPCAMIFSTIIGAFAGHKIVTLLGNKQLPTKPDDDKNIDVNGEDK